MEFIVFWIFFSAVAWIIASRKGRWGFGYFLLSIALSPLIGIILALLAGPKSDTSGRPNPKTHLRCPDCREFVLKDAKVYKHCGCRLKSQD